MGGLIVRAFALFAWTRALGAIGRRAGPRRVGLLLGMPSTSAAALVACGAEHGTAAAVVMADAGLLGLAAAVTLPAAYARAAGRGRTMLHALVAALAGYAAVAAGLGGLPDVGPASRVAIAAAAIIAADRRANRRAVVRPEAPAPDRPRRGALAGSLAPAACLVGVALLRNFAGSAWAGLLVPFPAATTALLVATHAEAGPAAACGVAAAVPRGSLGTLAFLAVFRTLAPALGPLGAAALAVVAAMATLAAVEALTRRASNPQRGANRATRRRARRSRSRGTARTAVAARVHTNLAASDLWSAGSWSHPRPTSSRTRSRCRTRSRAPGRSRRPPPCSSTSRTPRRFGPNRIEISRSRRGPPERVALTTCR